MPPELEQQQQQQLIFNEEEEEEVVTNLLLLKPTTATKTFEMRERMLDIFPLSEQELDIILIGYREFTDINNTSTYNNNNNNNNNSSSRRIGFSAFHKKQNDYDEEVVNEQQQHTNNNNNNNMELLLKEIEYRFCLKSNLLIETALSQVLLIGTGYDESLEFKFLEAISILLGRRGSKNLLSILYKVAEAESTTTTTTTTTTSSSSSSDGGTAIIVQPKVLIGLIYRLILASYSLKTSQSDINVRNTIPQAWVSSLQEYAIKRNSSENEVVTLQIWLDWTSLVLPQAYQTLSTYVNYAIFTSNNPSSTRAGSSPILQFPNLMTIIQSSKKREESLFTPLSTSFWKYSYQTVPSSLALLSANFGATWYNLYTSDIDGLSFETFQRALLSYSGTTVILIQTTTGDAFGFYTECPWKESRKWYGSNNEDIYDEDEGGYFESFLFGLKPTLQFYGPTDIGGGIKGKKKRFNMFLNNPLNTSTRPAGELTGLAIGGISERTPRIHIPPSLQQCKAGSMDGVYDCGPLLSNDELFFNIDVMEVWAISSSETDFQRGVKAGKAQASVKEAHRIARATVDRAQFLEDFQSGQYINTLFVHREEARGRHSFCAADEEEGGYFLESKIPSVRKVTI